MDSLTIPITAMLSLFISKLSDDPIDVFQINYGQFYI